MVQYDCYDLSANSRSGTCSFATPYSLSSRTTMKMMRGEQSSGRVAVGRLGRNPLPRCLEGSSMHEVMRVTILILALILATSFKMCSRALPQAAAPVMATCKRAQSFDPASSVTRAFLISDPSFLSDGAGEGGLRQRKSDRSSRPVARPATSREATCINACRSTVRKPVPRRDGAVQSDQR
jgi:hypothetical protein